MPPDHSSSERRISGAGPWAENILTKHSKFYRKHFTRDERRESKTERRSSAVGLAEEEIETHRRESVAMEEAEQQRRASEAGEVTKSGSESTEAGKPAEAQESKP